MFVEELMLSTTVGSIMLLMSDRDNQTKTVEINKCLLLFYPPSHLF